MGFLHNLFSSPDYGSLASQYNRQTQTQVDQGLALINTIFSGGTLPTFSASSGYTPGDSGDYFVQNKNGLYTQFKGGGNRGRSLAKKGKLYTEGSTNVTGYTPQFFQDYANAYIQAANPQLAQQYQQNYNQDQYSMANRGLSTSSANTQSINDLNLAQGQAQEQIASGAADASNSLMSQVQADKQAAVNQLYQTANPGQAAQYAISGTQNAPVPSVFQPLGNIFSNFSNQYYLSQLLQGQPGGNLYSAGTTPFNSSYSATSYMPPNQ